MAERAMRRGHRALTAAEARGLRASHRRVLAAIEAHGWLSDRHLTARRELTDYARSLTRAGVPLSHLGVAIGVSKARAHRLTRGS